MVISLRFFRSDKLSFHDAPLNSVAFSPDGRWLASAGDDGNISIISSSGKRTDTIRSRQTSVVALAWLKTSQTRDSRMILSAGADGTIKLWRGLEAKDFTLVQTVTVSELPIEDIDVLGNKLAVVGRGGMFFYEIRPFASKVFEPAHCSLKGVIRGKIQSDLGKIRSVRLINFGQGVIVGTFDGVLLAWEFTTNRSLFRHRIETHIGNMDWHEDGRLLAVWNMDDGVDLYKIEASFVPQPLKICLKIRRNHVMQVRFMDADTLLVGSDSGAALLVNLTSLSVIAKLNHEDFANKLVQIVATCKRTVEETGVVQTLIATGSSEKGAKGTIRVWSTTGPKFAPRSWFCILRRTIMYLFIALVLSVIAGMVATSTGYTLPYGLTPGFVVAEKLTRQWGQRATWTLRIFVGNKKTKKGGWKPWR